MRSAGREGIEEEEEWRVQRIPDIHWNSLSLSTGGVSICTSSAESEVRHVCSALRCSGDGDPMLAGLARRHVTVERVSANTRAMGRLGETPRMLS